jgi:hypothetical protein
MMAMCVHRSSPLPHGRLLHAQVSKIRGRGIEATSQSKLPTEAVPVTEETLEEI